MTTKNNDKLSKIVNPELARGPLRDAEPHGEFHAIVRLAKPEAYPAYMKILGLYSPGFLKARIPCSEMRHVASDSNVVSVELCAHVSDESTL